MQQWGNTKDYPYYITEFRALKWKQNEAVTNFSKHFNKMYSKIPAEIKPSKTLAKITYVNYFDFEFSLLLRERRSTTFVKYA